MGRGPRRPAATLCGARARWLAAAALAGRAAADAARELPTAPYPPGGAPGPHTYLADPALIACTGLSPAPALAPWAPSIEDAAAFCSTLPGCGGFVYLTSQAALAGGGAGLAEAVYCRPGSFAAGMASAASGIAFARRLYASCDVGVHLPVTVASSHGPIAATRPACLRPGRGLAPARDGRPRPGAPRRWAAARKAVQLDGTSYEVGGEAFASAEAAREASADGSSHTMATPSGVVYHMAGGTHATREQSEKPFALDGYYPLYTSEAAAQAASARGGGNGQADAVGPTTALAQPHKWSAGPHTQAYYVPRDGAALYLGDYVAPFELDGYYPLFATREAAQRASGGLALSHGPGSEAGHPLSWSSGEHRVFYMPAAGAGRFYGDYRAEELAASGDYAGQVSATAAAGEGPAQAAAAQAAAAVAAAAV